MKKRGNISLEGYRKNSPDRFNDFNIIPSQHIDMKNVDHDVLMIPMGGRGTGNPILAKPGERYFFPNHELVFEQAMPENAMMRYQRVAQFGGLHKAEDGYEMASKRLMNSFMPENSNVFAQSAPLQFPVRQNLPYNSSFNFPFPNSNRPGGMYFTEEELRTSPLNSGFQRPSSYKDYKPKFGWERSSMTDEEIAYEEEYNKNYYYPKHAGEKRPSPPAIINFPYFPDERSNMTFQEMVQEWARAEREATNPNNRRRGNPYMLFEQGGPLPKAQMYNSQVGVPLNTNDFIYTPEELEKYKNIYDQRIANCKKGDAACLEQANNYYNLYVAPKLNAPNSWVIKENMLKKLPLNDQEEWNSWDLAGGYKQSGAKVNLAAPVKNPDEIQKKLASMSDEERKKYWINQNLPLGALVNFGQAGLDEHYGKGQAYNVSQGLVPSNHSARVSGYSPEGVPYIYDFGRITPITDPTFKSMPLTAITSPKEIQGYTFENLKKQGKLEGSKMNPLKINTKGADYDEDEYNPFINSLQKNKDMYANALGMSDEEYNNYAKHAAALALTETGGGDDASIRWKYGFPIPSYVTDKLGFGDTKGITQINPNVLFNKKSLADKLESVGIRKDNYDPWNSDHAAIATMALLKDNRAVQDTYGKTAGNKTDLSEAEKTYYQWSMPRTLRKGEAKGESEKIKKYLENYNKIQADFDPHNRYLAENRKFGGLHKAQNGRIQAATTYASGKEQNYMSPERRAYEQAFANQMAEKQLADAKLAMNIAGLAFYPASVAASAIDFSEGDYAQGFAGLIPFVGSAKKANTARNVLNQASRNLLTKSYNAGIPQKIAAPIIRSGKKGTIYGANAANVEDAYDAFSQHAYGGALLNKTLTCPSCGWSWKAVDGGTDITTCHKCGGTAKLKFGGGLDQYQTRGEVKPKTRTDVYTDKAAFDKAYKAEIDSINVRKKYDQTFTPGNKTRPLTNKEKEEWKDKQTGLYPNVVEYNPAFPGSRYFGHFKKPVVHNVYEEPVKEQSKKAEPKKAEAKKDYATRNVDFSSPYGPVMKYYDAAGKVIRTEPYVLPQQKNGGWLDELDEEYRRGGALPNRRETNKNIKSSINNLMRRNETLFGPRGRNFYNPNPMKKYYKGGIAFPQAPTAGDTPGQQETEFYPPNWIPRGPVGFYEHGGIAYPQQPTSDYFFSGSPWMAHYDMGGGLPSGANNMYMPCMNCGGYMEDGGMYYAEPGMIINPNPPKATPVAAPDVDAFMTEYDKTNPAVSGFNDPPKNIINTPKLNTRSEFDKFKAGNPNFAKYSYADMEGLGFDVPPEYKANPNQKPQRPYTPAGQDSSGAGLFTNAQGQKFTFSKGEYKPYISPTTIAGNNVIKRYGGFQEGGFMSPNNMMDYPTFSQGGDPYGYEDGGINNPGFRALPQNVQQNIISNMADGGNVADYDQDQYTRILGNNFMSGVQGNMQNNTMRDAGMQFAQNPYQMPEGEYGYNMNMTNMNMPNMINAGNMFAMQDQYNELKNKNKGALKNMYGAAMFGLGTANQYTKYKAKKAGKGTLPETPDMTTNQGVGNNMDQSAQTGMARYGAAYIPKAQAGFNARQMKAAGMPELRFPSPSSASTSANPNNLSPEALAKKQAFYDDSRAYDQKEAMYNQMQQAGYPNMRGAYPNMMGQQGQFAPNFQGMYDNFGNDDYRVGRMSRGMQNMLPYLMSNPQNTYLQEFNAKKALFGPGARKVSMKFRTVFDPRTGQQVQVPAEGKGGKEGSMKDPNLSKYSKEDLRGLGYDVPGGKEDMSTQKNYEDMNMFERMKSNRQTKRMAREDEKREKKWGVQKGIPENPSEEDFIKQDLEEQERREKKWGASKVMPYGDGLPGMPIRPYGPDDISPYGNFPKGTTFANNMAYAPAQSGYPTPSGYNFNASLNNTRPAYIPRNVFGTLSPNLSTGPLDQNKLMMQSLNRQRYGGMYEVGGIQELTEDEIQQIMEAGGSVTYLD